jgi:Kef-type K+ transport system membrane component KefB
MVVTLVSSFIFGVCGYGIAYAFGYTLVEALVVAACMMFSSTIIGLKLLPTTILHHQRTGEVVISILLLQDIIAILVMMGLDAYGGAGALPMKLAVMILGLPGLFLFCMLFERYILINLIAKYDRIQEYIFLLAIGWCLGIAELASVIGLSHEIGAFIAGICIATSPISLFIAESLKPLRDFFLILFFFSLGAALNLQVLQLVIVPTLILALVMMMLKPLVFRGLLKGAEETKDKAFEIGVRLGQISEFSLLVAYVAKQQAVIGDSAHYLIQASTILTFILSSYIIVMKYPTPISLSEKLRKD